LDERGRGKGERKKEVLWLSLYVIVVSSMANSELDLQWGEPFKK